MIGEIDRLKRAIETQLAVIDALPIASIEREGARVVRELMQDILVGRLAAADDEPLSARDFLLSRMVESEKEWRGS